MAPQIDCQYLLRATKTKGDISKNSRKRRKLSIKITCENGLYKIVKRERQRDRRKMLTPEQYELQKIQNTLQHRRRREDPAYRAKERERDRLRKRKLRSDPRYKAKEREKEKYRRTVKFIPNNDYSKLMLTPKQRFKYELKAKAHLVKQNRRPFFKKA